MAARTIPEHIQAALRLATRNPQGAEAFGNTPATAWFSFMAAIIALPLFFLSMTLGDGPEGGAAAGGAPGAGIAKMVSDLGPYAVGWLLFPVMMASVVQTIDRDRYYCRYVAAVNWCALVEYAVMTLLVSVQGFGLVPEPVTNILFVVLVVWVLTFQHFVARTVLQVDRAVAALLVALRMMLDVAVVALSFMLDVAVVALSFMLGG